MSKKNKSAVLVTISFCLFFYTNSWSQATTDWERVRFEREAKEARNRNDAKLQEQQIRDRINSKPGTANRGSSDEAAEYDYMDKTSDVNGIKIVRRYGLYGIVRFGKEIVPPVYYGIYKFAGRFYAFKGTDPENRLVKRIGFMDKYGTIIIPVQFDEIITNFNNGIATVVLNNERFQIDETGKTVGSKTIHIDPITGKESKVSLEPNRIEKEYYSSGELLVYRPFVNGQQNGIEKYFHKNGKIWSETPYTNGKKNGIAKSYHENGQLSLETFFSNGTEHGIVKRYFTNGKLESIFQIANGKATGIGKWYYESGKLRAEQPYIDGKKNGLFKDYYENGKLEKKTLYKDDKVVKNEPIRIVEKPVTVKVTAPPKNSSSNMVRIKNQVWMAHNLDVSTFRNGDSIPEAKTAKEWEKAVNQNKPAWCYYNNDPQNKKYGRLYNLYAVEDPRGLAPKGWHIASDAEWSLLTTNLGTPSENTPWRTENVFKTNASGFNDLLSGKRSYAETFVQLGSFSYWWSLSEMDEYTTYIRTSSQDGSVVKNNGHQVSGLSVRCVRD